MTRRPAQSILVSTTPHLEGRKVETYFGIVSAHVVAGTNIFSDIAASFSDVFGGESKSYKKQLEEINETVVDELRDKASGRGANALISLRIDHDQISGQNKEMFMVTASATAVWAEPQSEVDEDKDEETRAVRAKALSVEESTVRLLKRHRQGSLALDDDTWRFLIKNQVSDLARIVRDELLGILERPGGKLQHEEDLTRGQDYFLSLPEETAKKHLYAIASHRKPDPVDWAAGALEEGDLLDLGRINSMLEGHFQTEQKPALEILTRVDKPYYEPSDVEELGAVKSKIESGFGERGEVLEVEKDGMLSSGTEEVWQIKEGAHNPMDQEYCEETGLDIYGFGRKDTRPEDAIQALETKITALNRRFDS